MEPYRQLEHEFSEWAKAPHCVACASGTAALHLALESLPIAKDSEILIPEFTMIACARAASAAGLKPVFVDCGNDLLMDPDILARSVTLKTSAIMAVHIYGRRCNMAAIHEIADRHGLYVIEDMAEIHGIPPHIKTHAACWSFYKNKVIHGEEGGMVSFKEDQHASIARDLRTLGFTTKHDYLHRPRGWNHRLSNAHASLILPSLCAAGWSLCTRQGVQRWYDEYTPLEYHMPPRESVWVYDLKVPADKSECATAHLNFHGIAARMAFKPMSEQPEYTKGDGYRTLNAYRLSREIIYLPVTTELTREMVRDSVNILKEALA